MKCPSRRTRSNVHRDYNIIPLLPSGDPPVGLEKAAEATETSNLTVRRLRPWGDEFSAEAVGLVAGDLRHPLGIRIDGDTSAPHFPTSKVLKEEDVGALQFAILLRHFVGDEVASGGDGLV